jgi:RNA polymerase sigma factor (sigma-70 family)
MTAVRLSPVFQHLQTLQVLCANRDLNDGQLLERFAQHGDQTAFGVLIERYGSMVLGVCQRVLRNSHDTEDAFQAVFLVLVHKGRTLHKRQTIGNWLYGVAYHTALKARAESVRRRSKESQIPAPPAPDPADGDWEEMRPVLDQELNQLPAKLREALVLCDVLGRPRKAVAEELGVPLGTLSGRLTTARRQLAARLTRRGVALSAGALATVLIRSAASASVPAPLMAITVRAAAAVATGAVPAGVPSPSALALSKGVIRTMFLTRVKTVSVFVLAFVLVAGAALAGDRLAAPAVQEQKDQKNPPPPAAGDRKPEPRKELKKDGKLKPFSRVYLKSGTALIRQTGTDSLELKGQANFTNGVRATVADGVLLLDGSGVDFIVGVKELSGLAVEGDGTIEARHLKTRRLEVSVKGAGKVLAAGTADEQVITVSDEGTYYGKDCYGTHGYVRVDTRAAAEVNIGRKLKVKIEGTGRVHYWGKPAVEEDVSPTGHLVQKSERTGGFGNLFLLNVPGQPRVVRSGTEERFGADLDPPSATLRDQLGLPEKQGLVLELVTKGAAADRAGLKPHDILLEFDGKPVPSDEDEFWEVVSAIKPDQKVSATVLRKGRKQTIKDLILPEATFQFGFPLRRGGRLPLTQPPLPNVNPTLPPE